MTDEQVFVNAGLGWASSVYWLSADQPENPFAFEVLDCRTACRAFAAATRPQASSEAVQHIKGLLAAAPIEPTRSQTLSVSCRLSVPCSLAVSGAPQPLSQALGSMLPDRPHDRWLFQSDAQTITARRAWTGQLIHSADFEVAEGGIELRYLVSDKAAVFCSPNYAIEELKFLLAIYVSAQRAAYPIPPDQESGPVNKIASTGWARHGWAAEFARKLPVG